MHLRMKKFILTGLLSGLLFLLAIPVGAIAKDDADDIVKRVRKTLDGVKTLSCSFETTQFWKELDRTQNMSGTIRMNVKRPFRLRLERPGNTTVIDGKTIWTYLPKHRQVQISDFQKDAEQFPSPHTIFKRYSERRDAELAGEEPVNGSDCDIISLTTDDPTDVKVTVWIDRELHFPVKAIEETPAGDIITHVLGDVVINEDIDDAVFTFVTPDGVTKVDLRD
jgi:outer membrane lipoprotein-sorting protein